MAALAYSLNFTLRRITALDGLATSYESPEPTPKDEPEPEFKEAEGEAKDMRRLSVSDAPIEVTEEDDEEVLESKVS